MIDTLQLQTLLQNQRERVLDEWTDQLSESDRFFLFRQPGGKKKSLLNYFEKLGSILFENSKQEEVYFRDPLPVDAVLRRISVLLTGKEVLLNMIREQAEMTGREWILFRLDFNRKFHALLKLNAGTACDYCQLTLDEKEEELWELESKLRQMNKSMLSKHEREE